MPSASIGTSPSSSGPKPFWETKIQAAHLEYFTKDGMKKKINSSAPNDSFKRSMLLIFILVDLNVAKSIAPFSAIDWKDLLVLIKVLYHIQMNMLKTK